MKTHCEKLALELMTLDLHDALCVIEGVARPDLDRLRRDLERVAEWSTWLARYVDEREGFGCGDKGHASAVRAANRAARTLWRKAFGYNGFVERRPEAPKGAKP